jgi:hypothetical protein
MLLLQADPVGRLGGTSRQLPGTTARIGEHHVDQPRRLPATVGQRGTEGGSHASTGDPRAGIEAERPARRPDVVQAFDSSVLSDAALPAGPRGPQLGTGGGEPLGCFRQPRGADCSAPDRRTVEHQQLAAEPFNPMPSLGAGVLKLATMGGAHREREGGDDNDEHHRNQEHRSQQNGGHRVDSTPVSSTDLT